MLRFDFIIIAVLGAAKSITQSNNTDTTYTVRWGRPNGNLDGFVVECICNESNPIRDCRSQNSSALSAATLEYRCENLTAGSRYTTHVRTVRTGWEDHLELSLLGTRTCRFLTMHFYYYNINMCVVCSHII